jgi:uncharacterized protein (TIGR03437 family)
VQRLSIFFLTIFLSFCCDVQGGAPAVSPPETGTPKIKFFPRESRGVKPSVTTGNIAVVNAASFLPGISPGALVTIFGSDLTDVNGIVAANTNPLPYELAHVSVDINGVPAPIFSIAYNGSEDQISVQVPYGAATGPGAVLVEVFDYDEPVGTAQTDSYTEDPGIFTYQDNYAVALLYPGYTLIGPSNPAYPGDYIILYTTGLGPLSLDLRDGFGAPADPLAHTEDPFQVYVGGELCDVFFSGLAPGFVGLYQLNIQLPSDLRGGNLDVQIISPYANSNVATLPVL